MKNKVLFILFLICTLFTNQVHAESTNIIYANEPAPLLIDEQRIEYLGEFFITYYCPCGKCNGYDKYGNPRSYDGFGTPLKWGTVATDKKIVPMHTKLIIEGYERTIFEALDTGSHIDDYDIDIFVPVSHKEAYDMCKGEWLKAWKVY